MPKTAEILRTERLVLRELDADCDADFILELLNTPKFIQYIGDRGVRTVVESSVFIETRYRESYRSHGYGLYAVERIEDGEPVGVCGFVRRESLAGPDIGFAFLPRFERLGYGFESARAILDYGHENLKFDTILAIATPENTASRSLLEKLGFKLDRQIEIGPDLLNLYRSN